MKADLCNYELFPMVFPVGRTVEFTLRPLGAHSAFSGEYRLILQRLDSREPINEFSHREYSCTPGADGAIRFTYRAPAEGEIFVRLWQGSKKVLKLPIYALEADLACRIPLRGDLHVHTDRSHARECPAVVCANYRRRGYDFMVISEHHRYDTALEAIAAWKDVKTALNILPAEEVHLPDTWAHIVNMGGLFSVNALVPWLPDKAPEACTLAGRRFDESITPPPQLTPEEFAAEIDKIEAGIEPDFPVPQLRRSYAVFLWAFDKIREADGLAIFAHPCQIKDTAWHTPEKFTRYMLQKHPFDAFEVLGGEDYFEQNGLQAALYYDEYRAGRIHPIVGSTDSHGSTENHVNCDICSTVVLAKENGRKAIQNAIKEGYSVAVDSLSREYRLVGEYRLQKYGAFLMENYFPVHDREAAMEGELMLQYLKGDATAGQIELIADRAKRLTKKLILTA